LVRDGWDGWMGWMEREVWAWRGDEANDVMWYEAVESLSLFLARKVHRRTTPSVFVWPTDTHGCASSCAGTMTMQ